MLRHLLLSLLASLALASNSSNDTSADTSSSADTSGNGTTTSTTTVSSSSSSSGNTTTSPTTTTTVGATTTTTTAANGTSGNTTAAPDAKEYSMGSKFTATTSYTTAQLDTCVPVMAVNIGNLAGMKTLISTSETAGLITSASASSMQPCPAGGELDTTQSICIDSQKPDFMKSKLNKLGEYKADYKTFTCNGRRRMEESSSRRLSTSDVEVVYEPRLVYKKSAITDTTSVKTTLETALKNSAQMTTDLNAAIATVKTSLAAGTFPFSFPTSVTAPTTTQIKLGLSTSDFNSMPNATLSNFKFVEEAENTGSSSGAATLAVSGLALLAAAAFF